MSDNNKFWLCLWAMLAASVVLVVLTSVCLTFRHDEKMAALGYQETYLPGKCQSVWQKVPQCAVVPMEGAR